MHNHNKLAALFTIGLAAVCLVKGSGAAELTESVKFNIEPQALETALLEFSKQAGVQVFGPSQAAMGKKSAGIQGEQVVEEALKSLLKDSGLTYRRVNKQTVAIGPAEGSAAAVTVRSAGEGLRLVQTETTSGAAAAEKQNAQEPSVGSRGERVEEIVVTAQKRKERLQDVPISMSVLQGDDLDRSTAQGVTDALNRVPGVVAVKASQGAGTQIVVRGVTSPGALFFGSSPVSYYLDTVSFGLVKSGIAPDSNAFDLERIEVLRGPQGTLYGASAQTGVVRILTKPANPDAFEFKARTSVSSTEHGGGNYRGDVAANVPIVDGKLAARAVVGHQSLSGWIDHPNKRDANDGELGNLRVRIDSRPTERLSIGLSAWLSRADYGVASIGSDNRQNRGTLDESIDDDYDTFGLKIGYEFSGFSLTSSTGYLDYRNDSAFDYIVVGLNDTRLTNRLTSRVFSQEIGLNSTHAGPWRWSVGAMYRDGDDKDVQARRNSAGALTAGYIGLVDYSTLSESYAGFGELTRILLDGRLELTAGLRHFEDDAGERERSRGTTGTATLVNSDTKFKADSPRLVLTWHPSAQLTAYASYAEGFRSGFSQYGTVRSVAPNLAAVRPDNLTSYELGAKGALAGGRIEFDTAVFFVDWQDVQQSLTVNAATAGNPPVNVAASVNGESASGLGLEFGVMARPVAGLSLGLNFSWNDLQFDSNVISLGVGSVPVVLFAKGDRLGYSPEQTVGASAEYAFPLGGNGLEGRFSTSINYASKLASRTLGSTVVGGVSVPTVVESVGDAMVNSQVAFSIDTRNNWSATLFVENVTNEDGASVRGPAQFRDWDVHVRPRTIGAQLEYRFDNR